MAGWQRKKRLAFEESFYAFLRRCVINSKDKGRICLGENLYDGQRKFITTVFDALEDDVHKIFVLKARQLGLSTISRALSVFYLGMHDGLKGALVFDTIPHKESARRELVMMIRDLPKSIKFPTVRGTGEGNRESLTLVNDSTMLFMSAGVKKSKASGTLGRSEGLTMAHLSEICSFDNSEGLKSFEQSLSEEHPNRLYLYESTARGFNEWKIMWDTACKDTAHCRTLFLGWWSKASQSISEDHLDFERYGLPEPTELEMSRINAVWEQYGVEISRSQLAWIRRKVDPTAMPDGDTEAGFETEDAVMLGEQAWTEQEAFQQTGSVFFNTKDLTDLTNKYARQKSKNYMVIAGEEFADMKIYVSQNARSTELKVWEEPALDACYVFGVDPAYGENDKNCNATIEVLRCYADGWDQVAEYAWPLLTTRHLAWVLAALLGWYGGNRNEARYILELNGPGEATFNEIRSLKFQIDHAKHLLPALEQKGLLDVFKNVKTYLYTKPDSLGAGWNYHWKTTTQQKITVFEQLRDVASNGKGRIRSFDAIEEMRSISREGASIGAPGSMRDDRVIGLALANHYWQARIRPMLITQRRTRDAEEARQRMSIVDQVGLFNQNNLDQFFAQKRQARVGQHLQMLRQQWRFGSRRY